MRSTFNQTDFNSAVTKAMAKHNAPENTNEEDGVCVSLPPKTTQRRIPTKAQIRARSMYCRGIQEQIETSRQ
jgi:hypothetical protein